MAGQLDEGEADVRWVGLAAVDAEGARAVVDALDAAGVMNRWVVPPALGTVVVTVRADARRHRLPVLRTTARAAVTRRRLRLPLVVVALAVAAISCSSGDRAPTGLEDRSWVLDLERTGVSLGEQDAVTLRFDDGIVGGQMICNSFSAAYELDGDVLTAWTGLAGSAMGCVSEAGTIVGETLAPGATFEVEGQTMTVWRDGQPALVFFEVPNDPGADQARLTGSWEVLEPGGGAPADATLEFDADGHYDVEVGCKQWSGDWDVEGGHIGWPQEFYGGETEDEGCRPAPDDEALLSLAIAGRHLRTVDDGLEVLDHQGVHVATLRPLVS